MAKPGETAKYAFDEVKHRIQVDERHVLIIEDDQFAQKLFCNILTSQVNHVVPHVVSTFDEALRFIHNHGQIHLIIMDVFLGEGRTGIDLFRFVSQTRPELPVVLTSVLDEKRFRDLLGESASTPPFLRKPFHPDLCAVLVGSLLQKNS